MANLQMLPSLAQDNQVYVPVIEPELGGDCPLRYAGRRKCANAEYNCRCDCGAGVGLADVSRAVRDSVSHVVGVRAPSKVGYAVVVPHAVGVACHAPIWTRSDKSYEDALVDELRALAGVEREVPVWAPPQLATLPWPEHHAIAGNEVTRHAWDWFSHERSITRG